MTSSESKCDDYLAITSNTAGCGWDQNVLPRWSYHDLSNVEGEKVNPCFHLALEFLAGTSSKESKSTVRGWMPLP